MALLNIMGAVLPYNLDFVVELQDSAFTNMRKAMTRTLTGLSTAHAFCAVGLLLYVFSAKKPNEVNYETAAKRRMIRYLTSKDSADLLGNEKEAGVFPPSRGFMENYHSLMDTQPHLLAATFKLLRSVSTRTSPSLVAMTSAHGMGQERIHTSGESVHLPSLSGSCPPWKFNCWEKRLEQNRGSFESIPGWGATIRSYIVPWQCAHPVKANCRGTYHIGSIFGGKDWGTLDQAHQDRFATCINTWNEGLVSTVEAFQCSVSWWHSFWYLNFEAHQEMHGSSPLLQITAWSVFHLLLPAPVRRKKKKTAKKIIQAKKRRGHMFVSWSSMYCWGTFFWEKTTCWNHSNFPSKPVTTWASV